MPQRFMYELKGIVATAVSLASATVANLPDLESIFRIGVSITGILATGIMARYWWYKGNEVIERRKKEKQEKE